MTKPSVLSCRGVTKRYGKQLALNDLELDVREGEIFGLLGPNGAGKTTFIKIVLGLAMPHSGSVELFGGDIFRDRKKLIRDVGAVVEAPVFFEYMTAWENLYHLVSLSSRVNRKRLQEVLHMVGLEDAAKKPVGAFSYGMKQRLGIAQALLPETKLLILDEPTNGLDPHGIAGIRSLIQKLRDELNITIFLSSHLLVEVERVCERVAIVHHGKKVLEGEVSQLKGGTISTTVHFEPKTEIPKLENFSILSDTIDEDTGCKVAEYAATFKEIPSLVQELVDAGARISKVMEKERSLEDIFIEHTKGGEIDVRIDSFRD